MEDWFSKNYNKLRNICKSISKENDVVYDPFMGTGTTAAVAKKMNRNYIGSEISENYIEVIKKRLERNNGLFE